MTEKIELDNSQLSIPFEAAKTSVKKIFLALNLNEEKGLHFFVKAMDELFEKLCKKGELTTSDQKLFDAIEYINDFLRGKNNDNMKLGRMITIFGGELSRLERESHKNFVILDSFIDSFIEVLY